MNNGTCTCEGAAFEYVFNVEAELGDFGVDGIQLDVGGYITPSSVMAESHFFEKN